MNVHDQLFTVVLQPEPEGGFTVRVPSLPEIVTYGHTEQEALEMAEDAIRLAVEYRRERGEEIPPGSGAQVRKVKVALPA
jgi:antitoxin HicB